MSDEKKTTSVFVENIAVLTSPEGLQRYLLGTKKNGTPRAVYDVVKDYSCPKKKKKKDGKKKHSASTYSFYLDTKNSKKKKKKKKNKDKYWHI